MDDGVYCLWVALCQKPENIRGGTRDLMHHYLGRIEGERWGA